jgi:predicted oxidoreductase
MRSSDESDITALAWVLSHPSGIIPLLGSTNISRVKYLINGALSISANFTAEMWWHIGGAGGLCAYADSQCNYELYKA